MLLFATDGVKGVGKIRPGRGRKPSIAREVVDAIVSDTLHAVPMTTPPIGQPGSWPTVTW